jgi:hypothetical protein
VPINKSRYPANWRSISLAVREEAGWKCEWCGARHREPHPVTGSMVILTVAHLGINRPDGSLGNKHDTHDVRPENLAALCQRCHLNYDRADHIASRHRRRSRRIGQLVLPFGIE